MIKQLKTLILICTFLTLIFSSCKKESALDTQNYNYISQNELKSLISQVKVWHDSTVSSNLKSKVQNGLKAFSVNDYDIVPPIVNWEKAFINFDSSDVKSVTIPISMNYKNGEHIELVVTKSKNKLNGYYIKVTPDSAYFGIQIDIYNYTNFSGSISIYNFMGIRLKKQDFKSGIVLKLNNGSKKILSNNITYGDGYNTPYDLIDVTVKTVIKKSIYTYAYNYGLIYIDVVQNIGLDQGDGGGGVIAGGLDFDFNLVPNGQCVFGALAYLGAILNVNKDPKYYLKQWADLNNTTLDNMNNKLITDPQSGPNIEASVKLLSQNFENYNLGNMDNMLSVVKNYKIPVFVIIIWPKELGGGGHAGIVEWSNYFNRVVFYDPVLEYYFPYEKGAKEFDYSKYFFGVTLPK